MSILPYSFGILQYLGLWQPTEWSPGFKSKLYQMYTVFMILFIYTNAVSEIVELLRSFKAVEEFVNNSIVLLTVIGICGKVVNILGKRHQIVHLMRTLQSYPCRVENPDEESIQTDIDEMIKTRTLAYATLTEIGVVIIVGVSLLCDIPKRTLPYNAWLPFDPTTSLGYWIAFTHQTLAHVFGAFINVAYDTLVPGIMLQACAQFRLLEHRMHLIGNENCQSGILSSSDKMQQEKKQLANCVRHHLQIFQFAKNSNNVFGPVIVLQYCISTIVICVSVYGLSQAQVTGPEFAPLLLYLACMLMEVFVLCLAGTELTLESYHIADIIYHIDWCSLNIRTQKSLLLMMIRSSRPIKFTTAHFIELSIESFNQLVKLSYSAYNVLQQASGP